MNKYKIVANVSSDLLQNFKRCIRKKSFIEDRNIPVTEVMRGELKKYCEFYNNQANSELSDPNYSKFIVEIPGVLIGDFKRAITNQAKADNVLRVTISNAITKIIGKYCQDNAIKEKPEKITSVSRVVGREVAGEIVDTTGEDYDDYDNYEEIVIDFLGNNGFPMIREEGEDGEGSFRVSFFKCPFCREGQVRVLGKQNSWYCPGCKKGGKGITDELREAVIGREVNSAEKMDS